LATRRTARSEKPPIVAEPAAPLPPLAGPRSVGEAGLSKDVHASEGSGSYAPAGAGVGSKDSVPLRQVPQSVSVITRQRMDDQNLTTLEDALRNTTGMIVNQVDAGRTDFQTRGYNVDSIQVDGVTQNRNNFFGMPDLFMYDRVEVLRGPNALFTGSGEPSGAVNLVRKRALNEFQALGSASYGSYDAKRVELDATGPLNEARTVRGRIVGAWDDKELFYQPSFYRKPTFYGTLEFDLTDRTTLSVGTTYSKVDYTAVFGIPAYANGRLVDIPRSFLYGADWNRWSSTTVDSFVELEHRFDNGGKAKVTYRDTYRDADAIYLTPNTWNSVTGIGRLNRIHLAPWTNTQSLDGHYTTPFELFGQTHDVILGADWRKYDYTLKSGSGTAANINLFAPYNAISYQDVRVLPGTLTVQEQWGAYGRLRIRPTDWLTLIGGGRLSQWETFTRNRQTDVISGTSEQKNKWTGQYGVVVDVTKQISLYGSYADIFQPQTSPMADGGVVPPRVGSQKEVGLKTSLLDDRLIGHLAFFQIDDVNRAMADPLNPTFSLPSGEQQSKGYETEITGKLLPNWDVTAGYAFTETRIVKAAVNQEGLPFSASTPKHNYNLWTKYTFDDGWLRGFSVAGGYKIVSSFGFNSGSIRFVQPGYQVFTGQIAYRVNEHLSMSLTATNAFNQKYYQWVAGASTGNRYGEPRSVIFKVSTKW
jgi:outer membrane receptor for ferric coprogen and ferric-rhodotorulic acid